MSEEPVVLEPVMQRAQCEACKQRSRALLDRDARWDWHRQHDAKCSKAPRKWRCIYCGAVGRRLGLVIVTRAITNLRDHYKRCSNLPLHKWRAIHGDHDGTWCPYGVQNEPGQRPCPRPAPETSEP